MVVEQRAKSGRSVSCQRRTRNTSAALFTVVGSKKVVDPSQAEPGCQARLLAYNRAGESENGVASITKARSRPFHRSPGPYHNRSLDTIHSIITTDCCTLAYCYCILIKLKNESRDFYILQDEDVRLKCKPNPTPPLSCRDQSGIHHRPRIEPLSLKSVCRTYTRYS